MRNQLLFSLFLRRGLPGSQEQIDRLQLPAPPAAAARAHRFSNQVCERDGRLHRRRHEFRARGRHGTDL